MSVFAWVSRRVGGLSVVALLALCYWVLSKDSTIVRHGFILEQQAKSAPSSDTTPQTTPAGIWTSVFAYYSLFIHSLVVLVPIRACCAIWDITKKMQRSSRNQLMQDYIRSAIQRRGSQASMSSSSTLTPDSVSASSAVSELGDTELEAYTDGDALGQDTIIHAIIIPNYKEEMDTLKETLEVLASHPRACTSYDVRIPQTLNFLGRFICARQ